MAAFTHATNSSKRNFVVQISRQLTSRSFACELHCLILLNLLVAFVYWVFFMEFNKFTLIIINLLPESYRILVGIDLFHVACLPATTPCNLEPVPPPPCGNSSQKPNFRSFRGRVLKHPAPHHLGR